MLTDDSLKKLTDYYISLLGLLDAKLPSNYEGLNELMSCGCPATKDDVLRRLTKEEVSLVYADFAVFLAVRDKGLEFAAQGFESWSEAPGGELFMLITPQLGSMLAFLSRKARIEFVNDPRLAGQEKSVRVEMVDGVWSFVTFRIADVADSMAVVASAVNDMLGKIADRVGIDKSCSGNMLDLEQWNISDKKAQ